MVALPGCGAAGSRYRYWYTEEEEEDTVVCSCAETDIKTQLPSVVDFVDDRSGYIYILESIMYANPK